MNDSSSEPISCRKLISDFKQLYEPVNSIPLNEANGLFLEHMKQASSKLKTITNDLNKVFKDKINKSKMNDIESSKDNPMQKKDSPSDLKTIKHNPIQEMYQTLGIELSREDEKSKDIQPVQAIFENVDLIMETLDEKLYVGEYLTDIFRLKNDQSFILISNHIHPAKMAGFVTKYSKLDDIPYYAINYLNPGYGLANTLAVRDSSTVKVFVGFDSGNIIMFDDKLSVLSTKQFCHNIITKIQLSPGKQDRFICADYEGRIVLVDCEELEPLTYYDYAHSDSVNDVVFNSQHNDLIITAGSDHDVLLWDFRISRSDRPASVLTHISTKPTALDWSGEHEIIFGTEAGNVVQFDIRNKKLMNKHSFFPYNCMESERDCTIVQLRPLKEGKYLTILADNHQWIFDRKMKKRLEHHIYSQDIKLKSCIEIIDENVTENLLTIGNAFNLSYYPNILP